MPIVNRPGEPRRGEDASPHPLEVMIYLKLYRRKAGGGPPYFVSGVAAETVPALIR